MFVCLLVRFALCSSVLGRPVKRMHQFFQLCSVGIDVVRLFVRSQRDLVYAGPGRYVPRYSYLGSGRRRSFADLLLLDVLVNAVAFVILLLVGDHLIQHC